jgi:hypothetical protein
MGLYTEIQDPISKEIIQIKTGEDCCSYHQIGDDLELHEDTIRICEAHNGTFVFIIDSIIVAIAKIESDCIQIALKDNFSKHNIKKKLLKFLLKLY